MGINWVFEPQELWNKNFTRNNKLGSNAGNSKALKIPLYKQRNKRPYNTCLKWVKVLNFHRIEDVYCSGWLCARQFIPICSGRVWNLLDMLISCFYSLKPKTEFRCWLSGRLFGLKKRQRVKHFCRWSGTKNVRNWEKTTHIHDRA